MGIGHVFRKPKDRPAVNRIAGLFTKPSATTALNHNYNKILESDWFLARPIFYQIGARAAKVSNNKVSNNKVRVLRMRALFIWFFVVTKYSLIFLKPSASRMAFLP